MPLLRRSDPGCSPYETDSYTVEGTTTSGAYLVVTGDGDIKVGSSSGSRVELDGDFDVLVSPSLFRLDINSMSVDILNFQLTAQGGLVIDPDGIVGAISVSAGSPVSGPGGLYSLSGTFLFDVNTTSSEVTVGGVQVPADSAEVSIGGDLKVGDPGSGQFDVSATIAILVDAGGVTLSLYGTAALGPLGSLSVGSASDPSTLTIDSSGLVGDLTLSGDLTPIAGTELTGSITLDFDTAAGTFMLAVGSVSDPADLLIAGGAVDLKGHFDLTLSPSGFLMEGGFDVSIMGASLAAGSFDAEIYKDSNGSPELTLYAGLTLDGSFGSGLVSFTADPTLAINTGQTTQTFDDGNTAPAETAIFDLSDASVGVFGFHASGSLIATISSSGFDIQIPQSDPLSLSFLGLGSMQVYGFIDSDGRFSITGQVGYDVTAGPVELYGGIGATIANTGFSAWFYGGANLDCGALGTVDLASISATITVMTDHIEIAAKAKVLGIGFHFDESLGGYTPPAHNPGLFSYNAPISAAGSVASLSAVAYDPSNDALPADGYNDEWDVTGPPDVLNGGNDYDQTSNAAVFTPTLGGAGTYTVSLYEVDGNNMRTLLKQSTINVVVVPPTITSLNLLPSYLSSGSAETVTLGPIVNSTNEALLEPAGYDPTSTSPPSQTTVPTSGSYWAVTEYGQTLYYPGLYPENVVLRPVDALAVTAPVYTATLYVRDPYNGDVSMSGTFNMFDIYNLTVTDPSDDDVTGSSENGGTDTVPSDGLLTLRRAIDIINDNANYQSNKVATVHFAPSLAGDAIELDQEEYFDHGGYDANGNPTPDIGYSDLGIEYPTIIDGSGAPGLTITNANGSDRRLFFRSTPETDPRPPKETETDDPLRLPARRLPDPGRPPTARAGLVVEIGDATLLQGHATVNVTLANTGPASISLDQYGFQFQVVPVGNAPGELSFVDPQPQPFGDSKYVFHENSLAGPGPLGNVSTTSTPDDTYTGGDGTLDGTNVAIAAGSSPTLLTRLQVSLNGLYLPTPGTFQIVLESGPDSAFQYESGGKELSLRYTSTPGTITDSGGVTLPSPVPEPPTFTLLASGVLALLAYARRGPARRLPRE